MTQFHCNCQQHSTCPLVTSLPCQPTSLTAQQIFSIIVCSWLEVFSNGETSDRTKTQANQAQVMCLKTVTAEIIIKALLQCKWNMILIEWTMISMKAEDRLMISVCSVQISGIRRAKHRAHTVQVVVQSIWTHSH